jgi:hypothetical protein
MKLHNEEHYNLCSSSDISRMIKLERMRRVGHISMHRRKEKCA